MILDTGAEVNIIAQDFVWQNSWKERVKEQKNEILGISDQVIKTDGKLVLEVSIKGATVLVEFLVVPVTNVYAILGIDFIRSHNVQIICEMNECYMNWQPNQKGTPRQVPLVINTRTPHLKISKLQNPTQQIRTENASNSKKQPTKKASQKKCSKNSAYTTESGRDSYGLSKAYPQIRY